MADGDERAHCVECSSFVSFYQCIAQLMQRRIARAHSEISEQGVADDVCALRGIDEHCIGALLPGRTMRRCHHQAPREQRCANKIIARRRETTANPDKTRGCLRTRLRIVGGAGIG